MRAGEREKITSGRSRASFQKVKREPKESHDLTKWNPQWEHNLGEKALTNKETAKTLYGGEGGIRTHPTSD